MKKLFTIVVVALSLLMAMPAQAQVKFGFKGGYNVTNMSISSDVIKKDNQTGWFIGPTAKVTLPVVGLGVDIAALYDQREAKVDEQTVSEKNINIPINVRYSIGLGSMASVYAAVGPQFGFNVGSKNYNWTDAANYNIKKSNFSINVGVGASLISHLEIGCNYNIVCGKTGEVSFFDAAQNAAGQLVNQVVDRKSNRTNAWQVYLAYYF